MSSLIEVQGLTKHFAASRIWALAGARTVKAVDDVSFTIEEGSVFGLVGESGCGKTTVGRLILRLMEPDKGRILFEGSDVAKLRGAELLSYRRKAQIIFQNPFSSLNPRRSMLDSLSAGYKVFGIGTPAERRQRLEALMTRVGLEPDYLDRYPHQFSGGQRQRLVIARALTLEPAFIVADEPVSALDVSIQAQILNLLRALQRDFRFTMLLISHDLRVIYQMSDQIGVMYLGRMVETGPKEAVYTSPLHPYTRALITSAPTLKKGARTMGGLIRGEVWDVRPPPNGCVFYPRCPLAASDCERAVPWLTDKGDGHEVACWHA